MSLSDKEKSSLEKALKDLKEQEELLSEQINFFQKESLISSGVEAKFEIRKRCEEANKKLTDIKSQIIAIEKKLSNKPEPKYEPSKPVFISEIPPHKKSVFLVTVFITISIFSYNSTSFATYSLLNTQVEQTVTAIVEKEMVRELGNFQLSELGQPKFLKRQELKQQKKQALYPKIWNEINSQHRFKIWTWVGIANLLFIPCLILTYFHTFIFSSSFFNILNLVNIGVFIILIVITLLVIEIPKKFIPLIPIPQIIGTTILAPLFSTLPLYYFIIKLMNSFLNSYVLREIFSENRKSLLLSSILIIGTILGVNLSLFPNSRLAIVLNCLAIAALLKLNQYLYDIRRIK